MKKTRILAFALAVIMLCTMLAGCNDGNKTVMTVNGEKISKDIFEGAVAHCCSTYEQNGTQIKTMLGDDVGDGRTVAEFLKDDAKDLILVMEAIRALAKENGVEFTEEEKKAMEEEKNKRIEEAGGRKQFIDELEKSGSNEAFYDYWTECMALQEKLQTKLFAKNGKYALNAKNIADTYGNDYFCVKHVLIIAETEADFETKKKLADEISARAKNGEDFDALIAEFGEDPGMEANKGGYVMDKDGYTPVGGEMVPEFAAASAALADGGVSEPVRSMYGYHIIKRYPLNEEHIATDLEGISSQVGNVYFSHVMAKLIAERVDTLKVEEAKEFAELDVYEILGVEKTIGEQAGIEESHEGHDHSAEGGEVAPEITLTPAE